MKPFLKTEYFVDKSIPYLILLLTGIIVIDIFFKEAAHNYHTELYIADTVIVAFFVIDIIFKYNRVRNVPKFLSLYWLDVLAVFPFLLLFRLFEEIILISESSVSIVKNLFHIGITMEEEVAAEAKMAKAAKTAELIAKEGRIGLAEKFFKPLRRLPRLFKGLSFYEHPGRKTTLYHKNKKK